MMRREIIRISVSGGIGMIIVLILLFQNEDSVNWTYLLFPFFCIGIFYAAGILLKIIFNMAKTYISCQFMGLLINPLWGTVLCILLFGLGIAAIVAFGWLIGGGRCIYSLFNAYQLDKQCRETHKEYYW